MNLSNLGPIRGVGLGIWERFEPNSLDFFPQYSDWWHFSVKGGFAAGAAVLSILVQETLQAVANSAIPESEKDTGHAYAVWTTWQDQEYASR